MRTLLSLAAAATLIAVTATPTLAKTVRPKAAATAPASTIPVNNFDPSGTYKDYPDWARRALSPRAGGGGGR